MTVIQNRDCNMEQMKQEFIAFVNLLNDSDLSGMCESRQSIGFADDEGGFFVAPTDFIRSRQAVVVYNSDGQADQPIFCADMRKILIGDAEGLLQELCYG